MCPLTTRVHLERTLGHLLSELSKSLNRQNPDPTDNPFKQRRILLPTWHSPSVDVTTFFASKGKKYEEFPLIHKLHRNTTKIMHTEKEKKERKIPTNTLR